MRLGPTTVMLVLASVTALTASAHADTPEQHVFGMGGYAPSAPRVESGSLAPSPMLTYNRMLRFVRRRALCDVSRVFRLAGKVFQTCLLINF